MLKSQTAEFLTVAAATEPMAVTKINVEAWHEVIGHLDYQEARDALVTHKRTSAESLRPAHIIRIVSDNQPPRPKAKWEAEY